MAKKAAIYVRVSTDRQTLENQHQALRGVAERRGWEIVAVYTDAGISGAKGRAERPGLERYAQSRQQARVRCGDGLVNRSARAFAD
jgi:DNA invertase Pin-like site-specific DNA recombinase